jgi:fructose-bisphosphate aldolase, class I
MVATQSAAKDLASLLGSEAEDLLTYQAKVSHDILHLPGADFIERIFVNSDRSYIPQAD